MGELLTQVKSAGMLPQMVAGWWTVASPKVAAQGGSARAATNAIKGSAEHGESDGNQRKERKNTCRKARGSITGGE